MHEDKVCDIILKYKPLENKNASNSILFESKKQTGQFELEIQYKGKQLTSIKLLSKILKKL